MFNIPVKGTHAHAYITSFSGFDELKNKTLRHKDDGKLKAAQLKSNHKRWLEFGISYSNQDKQELT